jgi:hypothetical protein
LKREKKLTMSNSARESYLGQLEVFHKVLTKLSKKSTINPLRKQFKELNEMIELELTSSNLRWQRDLRSEFVVTLETLKKNISIMFRKYGMILTSDEENKRRQRKFRSTLIIPKGSKNENIFGVQFTEEVSKGSESSIGDPNDFAFGLPTANENIIEISSGREK